MVHGFCSCLIYRAWVVVAALSVCFLAWYLIEKTKLGAYLRAGIENPQMVQALGISVPLLITQTRGKSWGLARGWIALAT
jgi:branched-chain amino acid transport system permease protein